MHYIFFNYLINVQMKATVYQVCPEFRNMVVGPWLLTEFQICLVDLFYISKYFTIMKFETYLYPLHCNLIYLRIFFIEIMNLKHLKTSKKKKKKIKNWEQ